MTGGVLGAGAGLALTAATASAAPNAEVASEPENSIDSFANLGPVTVLNPGASAFWWYDRGGGDAGFQHAGADIKTFNGSRHNADDQGKAIFAGGYVQYYVTITNVGTVAGTHNLQGGGAT